MKLKRTIEQWRNGDPEAMAYHMSEAAIMFAFKDAKADILALHAECERLRAALTEVNKVLTVEDSLDPHYGWAEWLDEHIRQLVTPNVLAQGRPEREARREPDGVAGRASPGAAGSASRCTEERKT